MGTAVFTLSERISQGYVQQSAHQRHANSYLAGVDRQAEEMFSRLVKQMAEREGGQRKAKGRKSNGMGRKDELYPRSGNGDSKQ